MINKKLLVVDNNTKVKQFLNFPSTLYKNENHYIRPLDKDIEKVFNPTQNKLFRKGKAIRWILIDNNANVIGRIAAFYDEKTAYKNDQPTGGCGFFDCINDQKSANILFDAAKNWLSGYGIEAMDGPINFGTRETFWGCLKKGFYEPIYNMPYNYDYYNELFENYGFKNYFEQYTFHLKLIEGKLGAAIYKNGQRPLNNNSITFCHHDKNNPEKSANNFKEVFNAAWAKFQGVKPVSESQAKIFLKSLKPIIDPKLAIFAYHDNKPIGFFIMIPDIYQITRKFNGKLNLLNKIRLFYHLKISKSCSRAIGLIFGVVPEFQRKGIAEGMILFFEETVKKGINYTDLEMNWIGDFNPKMITLVKELGANIKKTHITYRYLFDRNKNFRRAGKL